MAAAESKSDTVSIPPVPEVDALEPESVPAVPIIPPVESTPVTETSPHKGLSPGVVSIDSIRSAKVIISRRGGKTITGLTVEGTLASSFHIDSDVWTDGDPPGTIATLWSNSEQFIDNRFFEDDPLSPPGPTHLSVAKLNTFLRTWGKIPEFLEIGISAGKGYGVFAKSFIRKGTFLGNYVGVPRTISVGNNSYNFTTVGFKGETSRLVIDAENIRFANWTRFINDGKDLNCLFVELPYSVWVTAVDDIAAGTELLVSYGQVYWTAHDRKKID